MKSKNFSGMKPYTVPNFRIRHTLANVSQKAAHKADWFTRPRRQAP